MREFLKRGDIVLALVIIVGCFVLIACGIDSDMKGILGSGAGYVFGRGASLITSSSAK